MRARKRTKSGNVLGFFGEQFICDPPIRIGIPMVSIPVSVLQIPNGTTIRTSGKFGKWECGPGPSASVCTALRDPTSAIRGVDC